MKKTLAILTIIAAFLSISPTTYAQGTTDMTKDQQDVIATIHKMTAALQAGDVATVMSTYEPDAIVMFEPGKPASGTQVLTQAYQGLISVNPQTVFSGQEVFVAGDIAIHFTPWEMTGTAPDGTAIEQSGLSVAVLRRQPNGEWLMVIDNPHGQNLLNAK